MQNTESTVTAKTICRPIPFLLGTFLITWLCAGLMTIIDYNTHPILFSALDFLENVSVCGTVFQFLLFPPAGYILHCSSFPLHFCRAVSPRRRTGRGWLARLPTAQLFEEMAYSGFLHSSQPDLGILASALFSIAG